MRIIEEQIFDRRCDAARLGFESSVRFYDELLSEFADLDEAKKKLYQFEECECEECLTKEDTIQALKEEIKELKKKFEHISKVL